MNVKQKAYNCLLNIFIIYGTDNMGRYANESKAIKFFLGISGGGKPEKLWSPNHNICSNLKTINEKDYRDFEYCFKWWPGFSGNINFPVPSGDSRTPEEAYYSVADGNRNFYDTNVNYCILRIVLLTYIHDRLVEAEQRGISLYELYLLKGKIKVGGVKPPGY